MTVTKRKTPAVENLGGVAEIAEALGTRPTNVTTWIDRRAQNGCPEAIKQLRMGGLYDIEAWKTWAAARKRKDSRELAEASS